VHDDWRGPLLAGAARVEVPFAGRDPGRWPGYSPRPAVTVWRLASGPVAAAWDFSVFGGSFGEDDATALVAAADLARAERVPLVTLVRSGGTRLQEGMAALVGIPRARIALRALAEAGLPHLSVADVPTTGGVWISVASAADLRVAVEGATVAFAGPRVVEAVTGALPTGDSHTAASAHRAGLVDAVLPGEDVPGWLATALAALAPGALEAPPVPPARTAEPVPGSEQVRRSRARTTGGRTLLHQLLTGAVPLRAPRGDTTVAAAVGRVAGLPVVGVALAAEVHGRPGPDGYRLLTRAARLADRLDLALLTLVDTPGAEPGTAAEEDGVAPAMGEALDAVLGCRAPTLSLVHGEGGSGGALAAAATDVVLVTDAAYFAAIGPEGAAAALRRPPGECADLMGVTPADLLALGVADALADPADVAGHLAALARRDRHERLAARRDRWSRPLPGSL
jgi:acyl-CoA carboxylase subunit beta